MSSIAERLENIQAELDQAVVNRRNKVLTDLEAKLSEQIEKSRQTPDIQPTYFYAAIPIHSKDKHHFMRLCVDGIVANKLGYNQWQAPPLTWECVTTVKKRYKYEMRADLSGQDATHVGWELSVEITKNKDANKKKTQRTTPQHELPQYLRTDYGADGGC